MPPKASDRFVLVMSVLSSLLFYWGIMPPVVRWLYYTLVGMFMGPG